MTRNEVLHDYTEDHGFQHLPIGVVGLGDRDEVAAEEDPGDALDLKQSPRQRRTFRRFDIAEVRSPRRHHRLSGQKFQCRRVRGPLGLDEHAFPNPAHYGRLTVIQSAFHVKPNGYAAVL